ncbi:glycosyltransferase family 2 protein [bacterium D16-51]|nr:glycosyltransferase family 2 protein [bacterium D16-59]RKI56972.1 glycosyltransferase family 2 protein [bacterium D16-51]
MEKDLVSVIIPVYNTGLYIARGIRSCISQTYKEIEIIIVDDGSTDNTWEIVKSFARKDSRVKAFHQENFGVSAARNAGLSHARGDYIIFLDADDWLEKDAVEYLLKMKGDREGVIAACDFYCVKAWDGRLKRKRNRKEAGISFVSPEQMQSGVLKNKYNVLSVCFKLWPKKVIQDNCFDTELHHGEDGLFVFRAAAFSDGMIFSTEPKWNLLYREGSVTRSGYDNKMLTAVTAAEKMLAYNKNPAIWPSLAAFFFSRTAGLLNLALVSEDTSRKDIDYLREKMKGYIRFGIFYAPRFRLLLSLPFSLYLPVRLARGYRRLVEMVKRMWIV